MNYRLLLIAIGLILSFTLKAQFGNYTMSLDTLAIPNLPGVQSYAMGIYNGKWVIIGGRIDGLHQRQPFTSFSANGKNDNIIVIDPIQKTFYSASLSQLTASYSEQLSSTNMQFYQKDTVLYLVGGYGYSNSNLNHITYNKLTAVNLPELINDVINNNDISSNFRQISDSLFQVTGGVLKKIDNLYYLVGGQKFTGRYNPNNMPSFTQQYTNQIRVFEIFDDGSSLNFSLIKVHTDNANLHRRDFNVEAQIMPDGSQGITAFSGVFKQNADLPFLNCVNIDSSNYYVNNNFAQYYNHYHCAHIPLYDSLNNNMKTVFFGGISQFYDDNGTMVQDDNVPFVNTIAFVERDSNAMMAEYKLNIQMPGLMGSGSEFIVNKNLPRYSNGVIKLDKLTGDSILLGYIYGGINSSAPNIFFINNGTQSFADNNILKVYLIKNGLSNKGSLNKLSSSSLSLQALPNPSNSSFNIYYSLKYQSDLNLSIYDINGKILYNKFLENKSSGEHQINIDKDFEKGVYFIKLRNSEESISLKLIVN